MGACNLTQEPEKWADSLSFPLTIAKATAQPQNPDSLLPFLNLWGLPFSEAPLFLPEEPSEGGARWREE